MNYDPYTGEPVNKENEIEKNSKSSKMFHTIMVLIAIVLFIGIVISLYIDYKNYPRGNPYCSQAYDCTNCQKGYCECKYSDDTCLNSNGVLIDCDDVIIVKCPYTNKDYEHK